MEALKIKLLNKAIIRHGNINKLSPVGGKKTLADCFQVQGDHLFFWYNTPDNSTHIVKEEIK
jgi:hypothetical protein